MRNHANQQAFLLFLHCLFVSLSKKEGHPSKHFSSWSSVTVQAKEAWASGISPQGALSLSDGAQTIWHFSSQGTVFLFEMKTLPPSLSLQSALCLRCYLSVCLSVIRHFSSWRAVYLFEKARRPENISRLPALYLRCSTFSGISHYGELLACLKKADRHLPFLLRALSMTEKEADIQNFSS